MTIRRNPAALKTPATEKEMKSLMSMFVEYMGVQMNLDRINQLKPTKTEEPVVDPTLPPLEIVDECEAMPDLPALPVPNPSPLIEPMDWDTQLLYYETYVAEFEARMTQTISPPCKPRGPTKLPLSETDSLEKALQSNDVNELKEVCARSTTTFTDMVTFLMPKKRSDEIRQVLIDYIGQHNPDLLRCTLRPSGRNLWHMACEQNDVFLFDTLLPYIKERNGIHDGCIDSGWTALHYAAHRGNVALVEALLEAGAIPTCGTDVKHTWSTQNPQQGVTARQLVLGVPPIETHGLAYEPRPELQHEYTVIAERLEDWERKGCYEPVSVKDLLAEVDALKEKEKAQQKKKEAPKQKPKENDEEAAIQTQSTDDTDDQDVSNEPKAKKKTKSKKKKSKKAVVASITSDPSPDSSTTSESVVDALLSMGFTPKQVDAGMQACGDAATADDVVAFIFQQDTASLDTKPPDSGRKAPGKPKRAELERQREEMESQRLQAEQLAAKREEKRRRNREWNMRQAQTQADEIKMSAEAKVRASNETWTHVDKHPATRALPGGSIKSPTASVSRSTAANAWGADNDQSTIASSVDHTSVDFVNDDATVSTLGSLPRSTFAPPGFGPSVESVPESHPISTDSPWHESLPGLAEASDDSLRPSVASTSDSGLSIPTLNQTPTAQGPPGISVPAHYDSGSLGSDLLSSLNTDSFLSSSSRRISDTDVSLGSIFPPSSNAAALNFLQPDAPPPELRATWHADTKFVDSISTSPMNLWGNQSAPALHHSKLLGASLSGERQHHSGSGLLAEHSPSGPPGLWDRRRMSSQDDSIQLQFQSMSLTGSSLIRTSQILEEETQNDSIW